MSGKAPDKPAGKSPRKTKAPSRGTAARGTAARGNASKDNAERDTTVRKKNTRGPASRSRSRSEEPAGTSSRSTAARDVSAKSLPAENTTEKLQKVLANLGQGSRREMERWISEGRIGVNGKTATLGDRVSDADRIHVDGRPISQKAVRHRTILYNKPTGQICSRRDPEGRPSVFDKLPKLKKQRWISVGRLDFNTSGLLLLTTDGNLANRLMHPSFEVEREYVVRVLGEVRPEHLEAMKEGVMLEDGSARFTDIQKAPGEDGANQWYYVVLVEGRNREVRRLWESQGLTVSRLKRVRYGHLFIPSAIKSGRYIDVPRKELAELYRIVDLPLPGFVPDRTRRR